jgi:hypothetical protein
MNVFIWNEAPSTTFCHALAHHKEMSEILPKLNCGS